jgi:hypothetical protein
MCFGPLKWLVQDADLGSIAVLLEAPLDKTPFDDSRKQNNSVLLTIDLTKAVADEAIENRNSVVVAYRKLHLIHSRCDDCDCARLNKSTTTNHVNRPYHFPWPQVAHLRRLPTALPPPPSTAWNQRLLPAHSRRHRPKRHGRLALRRSNRQLQTRQATQGNYRSM